MTAHHVALRHESAVLELPTAFVRVGIPVWRGHSHCSLSEWSNPVPSGDEQMQLGSDAALEVRDVVAGIGDLQEMRVHWWREVAALMARLCSVARRGSPCGR